MLLGTAKWDAYGCSIAADPHDLRALVDRTLPDAWGGNVQAEVRNGRQSFAHMVAWKPEGKGPDLAWLQWGGVNDHAHLEWEGMHSPRMTSGLRLAHPKHRVSRADAAVDLRGPDVITQLWAIFEQLDRENTRLKGGYFINTDPDTGNSYYLGAQTSDIRCVLYEKGKQMARKTGDQTWLLMYRDVARIEARVRPKKEAKTTFATLSPSDVFGASRWLRSLAAQCFGLQAEAVSMKPSRTTDHDRAMGALTSQYAATLMRDLEMKGGDIDSWATELLDRCMEALQDRANPKRGTVLHGSALPH